jgi:hypothetical protein
MLVAYLAHCKAGKPLKDESLIACLTFYLNGKKYHVRMIVHHTPALDLDIDLKFTETAEHQCVIGMVRFGSVQFFEGFWRTQNWTIGPVHRLQRTLDQTVGSVQNS